MIVVYPCNYSSYTSSNLWIIRQIALISLLLFTCPTSWGSVSYEQFHEETNIDRKSDLALELWNYYLSNNIDSLKVVGAELLHDATSTKNAYALAVAYRVLGEYQIWKGDHLSGVDQIRTAARYFIAKGNYLVYSECLVSIGNSLFLRGDFDDAEKAYKMALVAGGRSGDASAWFAAELNLAKVFAARGDSTKAFEYANHFKNEAERLHKNEAVSNAYGFLAQLKNSTSEGEVKSEYLLKSVRYARLSGSENQLSHACNNYAIHHFYKGDRDSALLYFRSSHNIRLRTGNDNLICESYLNLANYYFLTGKKILAVSYADSSLITAINSQLNSDAMDALKLKCHELEDPGSCTKMDSLANEIEMLYLREDEILKSLIEIYTRSELEERSSHSSITETLLIFTILAALGFAVYRKG